MSGERILVVDDSPTQRRVMEDVLREAGLVVDSAGDGEEALARLEASPPDLVITDIVMPRVDGLELCRRIRAREETKTVPVVIVTRLNEVRDIVRGLQAGADNFLTKPYDPQELVVRVRAILDSAGHAEECLVPMRMNLLGGTVDFTVNKQQIFELMISTFQRLGATHARLEEKERELESTQRAREAFLASISHELRTPLTSLRGSLSLLAGGVLASQPQKAQGMIDMAIRNVNRLGRLLNDLIDLERMEAGSFQLSPRRCEVTPLLEQAAEDMRGTGAVIEVQSEDAAVDADPDRVVQVVVNLLSNAVKFSPKESPVALRAAVDDGFVRISVSDRGRGIPREDLQRVFDRYAQVESEDATRRGGAGLGLAICRDLVRLHGGRIWVESVVGSGSTFHFTLRRVPAAEA